MSCPPNKQSEDGEMTKTQRQSVVTLVTVARIILLPPIMFFINKSGWHWRLLALIGMIVCEASDIVDGNLARYWNATSNLGAILDPLADSMYRCGVFLAFMQVGWISMWSMVIFSGRDISNAYIRAETGSRGIVFGARMSGKIKAVAQGLAQCFALYFQIFNEWNLQGVGESLLYIAVLVTVWSWVDYFIGWLKTDPPALRFE